MKLREAKALRVFDDHQRRIRHVDADLDHGCRDQYVEIAGHEFRHHGGLRIGLHAAVQQPDPELGQRGGELGVQRYRRLQLELLGFLDQRTHPVDLPLFGACRAYPLDDLRPPPVVDEMGRDRRPSGRHLVQHRHVEIGIEGHRQRARNRRCTHHQLVGFAHPFAAQFKALRHAETMLLVDDRESKPRQRYLVLEQRVRADRKHRFPARNRGNRLPPGFCGQPARQPRDFDRQSFQPLRKLSIVLLGQNFRRRHQRHLASAFDRL